MNEEQMNRAERRKLVSRYRLWPIEGTTLWGWETIKPKAGSGTATTRQGAQQAAEAAKQAHRRRRRGRFR